MRREIAIRLPAAFNDDPAIAWAASHIEDALARAGFAVVADGEALTVAIAGAGRTDDPAAPVPLPAVAEGFALWREGGTVTAWGHDTRGLVYALTELADRARHATGDDPFDGTFPLTGEPTARIRSIARLFCAENEDKAWYYDKNFWREYLTMLATNRFNRFALTLGMGYNYPYHNPWITDVYFYFPYPFLFDLDGYDVRVRELPADERDLNLEMLQFIGAETARRGMDFQLALWTQRYDFDDVPRAAHTVEGITDDNLAPYCRDALTHLLEAVPEITGLTFRVHVEGGIAEGEYGFWEEAFRGVAAAGRPVEIDMHGKGLDHTLLQLARDSGMPFAASPKYLAEHMGLAYHQSSIRNEEYPPEVARSQREQLSEGSRKFLRYSYGDLLAKDKDYKVLYRIWAGTQRVLLWGDAALAAGYGRSSMFAGSDGVEWCEPLSFKGRMGTGVPGQRYNYTVQGLAPRYDYEKYEYQYRVWGRNLYAPGGPAEGWQRYLASECADAADACEAGLAAASRVLPLVTLTHAPSASNNHYWPEIYTNLPLLAGSGARAYARDMTAPIRFGNAPTFDHMLFANAREFAEALLAGTPVARYTPLDVADWLDRLAAEAETAIVTAKATAAYGTPAVRRILADVGILAGIARFFAEKYRAAVWAELFIATNVTTLLDPAIHHIGRAILAWEDVAALSDDLYPDDLTYGPQTWLRGSWQARLPEMRAELLDLEAARGGGVFETVPPTEAVTAAIAALAAHRPTRAGAGTLQAPASFGRGEAVTVRFEGTADGAPTLHFRQVDQSQRWSSLAMAADGSGYVATIPAEATQSDFHLQFFVTLQQDGAGAIVPGLASDLANEPYRTSLQR